MIKIMKSGFYGTNLKQINSRKLLNLLFKYISPINGPRMAIIIPIVFPYDVTMVFLWLRTNPAWPLAKRRKEMAHDSPASTGELTCWSKSLPNLRLSLQATLGALSMPASAEAVAAQVHAQIWGGKKMAISFSFLVDLVIRYGIVGVLII